MVDLSKTQHAVQLVGPDKLVFNKSKELARPGRHQLLCRVEVVGLCFSGLKLLKQFSSHARKGKIIVYPACRNLLLTPLKQLYEKMPEVAACLNNGLWTNQAEQMLLQNYQ